jgi:hypothetical protein
VEVCDRNRLGWFRHEKSVLSRQVAKSERMKTVPLFVCRAAFLPVTLFHETHRGTCVEIIQPYNNFDAAFFGSPAK